MTLDLMAAQAVARARLLERAAHDPGPWTVRMGSETFGATRVRTPNAVLFLVYVDRVPDDDVAFLCVGGEEVSSWDLTGQVPDVAPFTLQWRLSAPQQPVRA